MHALTCKLEELGRVWRQMSKRVYIHVPWSRGAWEGAEGGGGGGVALIVKHVGGRREPAKSRRH